MMVDSVLLLVDAFEGSAAADAGLVTKKAFRIGLRPIVVINKIDREGCNPQGTLNAVFDLFCALDATEEQLDFPVIYASGRNGYAIKELGDEKKDLTPLMDMIVKSVPPPAVDIGSPLGMQVATLDYDDYLGYVAIGRISAGKIAMGDQVLLSHRSQNEQFRVAKLLAYQALKQFEIAEAQAGDIVAR